MSRTFIEDFESEIQDPLDGKHCDFDWPGLYAAIGEGDEILKAAQAELGDTDYDKLGIVLNELFRFLIGDPKTPKGCERNIGRRLIGLAWCLRPDFFDGSPALAEIGRRLKTHKVVLSIHSAQAHRKFGIRNRAQSHAANFKPTLVAPAQTKSEHNDDTE